MPSRRHEVSTTPPTGSAVVVGAGLAGLFAARVLADHVAGVTVIERSTPPHGDEPRRGVPHGRHGHVVSETALSLLERWFPGIGSDLARAGAVRVESTEVWAGDSRVSWPFGAPPRSMSRPLLERVVSERLGAIPGVRISHASPVDGLTFGTGRVTGVIVGAATLRADLVVDASGRGSRLNDELSSIGHPAQPISTVDVSATYATQVFSVAGRTVTVAVPGPHRPRGALLVPIEGGRSMLTLIGRHGEGVPLDDAGFAAFARSVGLPDLDRVVDGVAPTTPVMTYRFWTCRRLHPERVGPHPLGYLALGDALASIDPIHGDGVTLAALEARELDRALTDLAIDDPRLPTRFYARAASLIDLPWQAATQAHELPSVLVPNDANGCHGAEARARRVRTSEQG